MILVTELMPEVGLALLRTTNHEIHYHPDLWKEREKMLAEAGKAHALVVRNQTQVDTDLLSNAPNLRIIGRLGVGLDNIDLDGAQTRNVRVVFARGANAIAVAEYVMAALLLLSRRLDHAAGHVVEGGWDRLAYGGFELSGKTLGLVGLGEVGLRVARRAGAFGMHVLAIDPARQIGEAVVEESGIALVDLGTVLTESEFISLHAPLIPETHHMMNGASIARMREGAYLINTARGGLVDGNALATAVKQGHLAGAVLDVVDPEPLPMDHPLRKLPTVRVTPHIAGLTIEAQDKIARWVAQGIIEALKG